MGPVTGSAPWSLLCNPGLRRSIGLWVERAGMASGARKMRGRKQGREGECMKRTQWISVTSLFIGWWRATLCVYPWPSFFLISPPPPLSNPPLPNGLQCTLLPSLGHPHPLSLAGKNKSDLIWLSPSYCQGLLEQRKTRRSRTWLEFTQRSVALCLHWFQVHIWKWRQKLGVWVQKNGRRHWKDEAFCLMPHGLVPTAGMDEQLSTTATLQLCPG